MATNATDTDTKLTLSNCVENLLQNVIRERMCAREKEREAKKEREIMLKDWSRLLAYVSWKHIEMK